MEEKYILKYELDSNLNTIVKKECIDADVYFKNKGAKNIEDLKKQLIYKERQDGTIYCYEPNKIMCNELTWRSCTGSPDDISSENDISNFEEEFYVNKTKTYLEELKDFHEEYMDKDWIISEYNNKFDKNIDFNVAIKVDYEDDNYIVFSCEENNKKIILMTIYDLKPYGEKLIYK